MANVNVDSSSFSPSLVWTSTQGTREVIVDVEALNSALGTLGLPKMEVLGKGSTFGHAVDAVASRYKSHSRDGFKVYHLATKRKLRNSGSTGELCYGLTANFTGKESSTVEPDEYGNDVSLSQIGAEARSVLGCSWKDGAVSFFAMEGDEAANDKPLCELGERLAQEIKAEYDARTDYTTVAAVNIHLSLRVFPSDTLRGINIRENGSNWYFPASTQGRVDSMVEALGTLFEAVEDPRGSGATASIRFTKVPLVGGSAQSVAPDLSFKLYDEFREILQRLEAVKEKKDAGEKGNYTRTRNTLERDLEAAIEKIRVYEKDVNLEVETLNEIQELVKVDLETVFD